jgi:hypothetical protein
MGTVGVAKAAAAKKKGAGQVERAGQTPPAVHGPIGSVNLRGQKSLAIPANAADIITML